MITVGTRVGFSSMGKIIYGTVTREPWGTTKQNVSIKTDDGRTFVRLIKDVMIAR